MAGAGEIEVRGLRELQQTFRELPPAVSREIRGELRAVAEPVRLRAEQLAAANISHLGDRWGRMRIGVTGRVVYVAPRSRRKLGSPRKNLGGLLLDRAMQPALEQNTAEIYAGLERMLDGLVAKHS